MNKVCIFAIALIYIIQVNGSVFGQVVDMYDVHNSFNNGAFTNPYPAKMTETLTANIDGSGQVNFSLPLFGTQPTNNFEFPIILTYKSGIPVQMEASWVGLGFDLTIGSIVRKAFVLPDYLAINGIADVADSFVISTPFGGGTIYNFGTYSSPEYRFEMDKPWKVDAVVEELEDEDGIVYAYDISRFIITMENGDKLVFSKALLGYQGFTNCIIAFGGGIECQRPVGYGANEWLLTAILSSNYSDSEGDPYNPLDGQTLPSSGWIYIDYSFDAVNNVEENHFVYTNRYDRNPSNYLHHSKHVTYPYRIYTSSKVLEFTLEDAAPHFQEEDEIIWSDTQYPGAEVNDQAGEVKKRISKIELFSSNYATSDFESGIGNKIHEVSFAYKDDQDALAIYQSKGKTTLSSILVDDRTYSFEYVANNPTYPVGYRDPSTGDIKNQKTDPMTGSYNQLLGQFNGSYEAEPGDGEAWNLERINLPLGGYYKFEYEDTYLNWTGPLSTSIDSFYKQIRGFSRVSRKLKNSITGTEEASLYEYAPGDNGMGFLYTSPMDHYSHIYRDFFGWPTVLTQYLYSRGSNRVIYSKIIETLSNYGKIERDYSSPIGRDSYIEGGTSAPNSTSLYENTIARNGDLVEERFYNAENSLIEKRLYAKARQVAATKFLGADIFYMSIRNSTNDTEIYKYGKKQLSLKNYFDPTHLLLSRKVETNSSGEERVTTYEYAHEEYDRMRYANMLSQLYSVLVENEHGDDLSKSWTIWDDNIFGIPGGTWKPWKSVNWKGDGSINDVTANAEPVDRYHAGSNVSELTIVNEVIKYDAYGNPLEVQDALGNLTKYYFGSNTEPFSQNGLNGVNGVYLTGIQKQKGTTGDDLFTEATYDELGRMTSITDENGQKTGFGYDAFNRLSHSFSPGGFASRNEYYYSLDGNGGSYNSSDPNSVSSVTEAVNAPTANITSYAEFTSFDGVNDFVNLGDQNAIDGASEISVSLWFNRHTDNAGTSNDTNHDVNNVLFAKSSDAYNDNIEIGTEGSNIELYMDHNPGGDITQSVDASIENNVWYHLVITYSSNTNQAKVYLDGSHVTTWTNWSNPLDDASASPVSLGLARPGGSQWGDFDGDIADVRVYDYDLTQAEVNDLYGSATSVSYLDGLGREVQAQVSGGNTTIVTGTLYDERGLPAAVTRPYQDSGISGYVTTDLFTGTGSFDPSGTGLGSNSPVEAYYDQLGLGVDSDYAFSYTGYEASPLARVEKSTLPGSTHKMGSGKEVETRYGLNTTETFSINGTTWGVHTLTKTITEDPDGKETITYTDGWGRTIASGVNMNPDPATGDDKLVEGTSDLITKFEYDERGNLVRSIDPLGYATTYSYNALGQLVEKKLPDQDHPNKYCYDDKGRLRFHADPNDFANPFNYNQDHYSYSYTKYDAFDRPVELGFQDASFVGNNSQASFEIICANAPELNDQNEPSANNTPLIYYSYDGVHAVNGAQNTKGRLTRTQYKDENTGDWGYTWYSYNNLGLVEWIKQQLPGRSNYLLRTLSYTYDALGRMTKVSYDEGYSSTNDHFFWYYYDELGRLEKVTSNESDNEGSAITEAEYTYFADGQVKSLILGSGVQTVDYAYTVQGWLDQINDPTNMGSDKFAADLYHSHNGNISRQRWEQAGLGTATYNYYYEYDNANRLRRACYGALGCSTLEDYDASYSYNANGNFGTIIRKATGTDPDMEYYFSYINGTNKIADILVDGVSSATEIYDYDASGNMTVNGIQNITSTTYDWRNLPTEMVANGTTMSYAYDPEGKRVKKTVTGGETTYYVRGADGQTFAAYGQNNNLEFINIVAGGDIIGSFDGTQRRYFLKDHLGSVRTTVDQSGNVDGYDDYYPFGLVMPGHSSNSANPTDAYKFTGHERDDEAVSVALDYMNARTYDPVIGRFLQIDPHYFNYRDLSPYVYVGNNPLLYIDPTGMDSVLYIRQTHQSANLTQQQKDQITSQAQSVFDQNGVPMTVEFVNLDSDGNAQFVSLDPTDVRIDLVDDNNPALKKGKADGTISQGAEGIAPKGSQEGLVTVDALTRNNVNETGVGNLVVHEGLHAMGLGHENRGTNIMNAQISGRQVNKQKQTIAKKHVSFIKNTFLKRK